MVILDYGGPTIAVLAAITIGGIAVLSRQSIWYFQAMLLIPVHVLVASTISTTLCIIYIVFTYYKMLFDQINQHIQQILSDGGLKIITKRKEDQLYTLLYQHNLISIEVHKVNLMLRKTAALLFITFSLIKIVSLYVMINTINPLMKMLVTNVFVLFFIFGFGLTYLFSMQIKSAHKSFKTIHSAICKFTMKLPIKLKVTF